MKASAIEVPIILAIILIVIAITGFMVSGSVYNEKVTLSYSSCKEAATQCLGAKAGSGNASCNFCDAQCRDPILRTELFSGVSPNLGAIGCCETGNATGIFEGSSGCAVCRIGDCSGQLVCDSDHNWAVDCTACGGDAACNSEYYCNSSTKSCQLRDIPCRIDSDCQALEGTCVDAYCSSGVCRVRQWQDYSLINMGKRCQNNSLSLRDELGYCFSSSPDNGACLECSYGPQHCNDTTVCSLDLCRDGFCDNSADISMNGKPCEDGGYCACGNSGNSVSCLKDTAAPSTALASPSEICLASTQNVRLECTDSVSGCGITYYSITDKSIAPSYSSNSLSSGCGITTTAPLGCSGTCSKDVWFYSRDMAGNAEPAKKAAISVDMSGPAVPSPVCGPVSYANDRSFSWSVPADVGCSNSVSGYNIEVYSGSTCSGAPVINANTAPNTYSAYMAEGSYSWRVRAKDGLNNWGAFSACSCPFTVDNSSPTTALWAYNDQSMPVSSMISTPQYLQNQPEYFRFFAANNVTLVCSDAGMGCDKTYYCVAPLAGTCTPDKLYTGTFGVPCTDLFALGGYYCENKVMYYSTDNAGKASPVGSSNFYTERIVNFIPGLMSNWQFDSWASGRGWIDSHGEINNFDNTPDPGMGPTAGLVNQSIECKGSSYVFGRNTNILNSIKSEITLSAWAYPKGWDEPKSTIIGRVARTMAHGVYNPFGLFADATGNGSYFCEFTLFRYLSGEDTHIERLVVYSGEGKEECGMLGCETVYESATDMDYKWTHVACTYSQATRTAKIYINGEYKNQATLQEEGRGDIYSWTADNIYACSLEGGIIDLKQTQDFRGLIDNGVMLNRTLSDQEIRELYIETGGLNCGNGVCEGREDQSNCCDDCGCSAGLSCSIRPPSIAKTCN